MKLRPAPATARRSTLLHLVSLGLASLALGCSPASASVVSDATLLGSGGGGGSGGGAGGGDPSALRAEPFERTPLLAAFDEAGALVLVHPTDAELVDRRELAHFGAPADLVFDAARGRLLVVLEDGEGEGDSSLVAVPCDGTSLGAPEKLAGAAGRARIELLPDGIVMASDGDGPRVRLLRRDGAATPGRPLDPVRSWWREREGIEGLALARRSEAVWFFLRVDDAGGVAVEGQALGVAPEDAVLVRQGASRFVALRDATGTLAIAPLEEVSAGGERRGALGAPRPLVARAGRLDAALAWPRGHLALLVGKPPQLVVTDRSGGEELALALAASAPSGAPYGKRSAVVVAEHLFVATKEGVIPFAAGEGPPLAVRALGGFDGTRLRGPLAEVPEVR